jgi:hypothetical protein
MIGVGKIKQYSNVLEKPLSKGKQEVTFLFEFSISNLLKPLVWFSFVSKS